MAEEKIAPENESVSESERRPRTLEDIDALLAGEDADEPEDDWGEFDSEGVDFRGIRSGRGHPGVLDGFGAERRRRHPQIAKQVPMLQGELSRRGDAHQLVVQERTRTGEIMEWGRLPADASLEALIELTGQAGHYLLTPIDNTGRELSQPMQKSVAPTHAYLREIRETMNNLHNGSGLTVGGLPSDKYLELFRELRQEGMTAAEIAKLEASDVRDRAEKDREALWRERSELNAAKLEMTAALTGDLHDVYTKAHEREMERQREHERAQQRAHEAALAREREINETAKRSSETQNMTMIQFMQMQMQEAERRREADDRVREERRAEERRREEARSAEERRRQEQWVQQQQQFFLMQQQMQQQALQREFAGKENLFGLKQQLLATAAQEKDPLQQIQQLTALISAVKQLAPDSPEKDGFLEKMMNMASVVLPAMMGGAQGPDQQVTANPPVQEPMPPPPPKALPLYPNMQEPPVDNGGYPPGYSPPQPTVIPAESSPWDMPVAQPPTGAASEAVYEVQPHPEPVTNALSADVRNKARRIIRNVVAGLNDHPEDQWEAVLVAQIMTDLITMQKYLQVVPVRKAIMDAGGSEEMAEKLSAVLEQRDLGNQFQIRIR